MFGLISATGAAHASAYPVESIGTEGTSFASTNCNVYAVAPAPSTLHAVRALLLIAGGTTVGQTCRKCFRFRKPRCLPRPRHSVMELAQATQWTQLGRCLTHPRHSAMEPVQVIQWTQLGRTPVTVQGIGAATATVAGRTPAAASRHRAPQRITAGLPLRMAIKAALRAAARVPARAAGLLLALPLR